MMGHTHALSGAVAYLAAAPLLAQVVPVTPGAVVFGAGAAAGAAMLPDFDHPKATIADVYGPLTRLLARVLSRVSGGHRNGTHSLLGLTIAVYLTAACQSAQGLPLAVLLTLLLGTAAITLHLWHPNHPALSALALAGLLGTTSGAALMAHDAAPLRPGPGHHRLPRRAVRRGRRAVPGRRHTAGRPHRPAAHRRRRMTLKRTVVFVLTCDARGCRSRIKMTANTEQVRLGESILTAAARQGWVRASDGSHRCPQHEPETQAAAPVHSAR
jgi:hypothetical protein